MADISSALRQAVGLRARHRCEYWLVPESMTLIAHEVDLSSIDPVTGAIERLFHPRRDNWCDHFELRGAEVLPHTAIGRVTLQLLQLNRPERIKERKLMIQTDPSPI